MSGLLQILKSRGKLGGVLLMLLGLGDFVGIAFGKVTFSNYVEAGGLFAAGLALLGIRSAVQS